MKVKPSPAATILSAFTEEDNTFLKNLASEAVTLPKEGAGFLQNRFTDSAATATAQSNTTVDPSTGEGESKFQDVLQYAALLGTFDPLQLLPHVDERKLKRLLDVCIVSTDGVSSRWSMRAGTREQLIAQMAEDSGGLTLAIEGVKRYLARTGESVGDITQSLLGIASGEPPRQEDFAAMSKEMLAANRAVIGWIQSIDDKLGFDAKRLLGAIELAELLEPFRFLTGFNPKTGGDTFVGRSEELRRLRTFVDALRSESLSESVQRLGRRLTGINRRVLGFSGVGGIGKSTLLAKFILQHATAGNDAPIQFTYLDFDRSTISAAQPVTLVLEMARQLGWQIPEVHRELEELRSRIREEIEQKQGELVGDPSPRNANQTLSLADLKKLGEPELPEELVGPSQLNTYLYEMNQILSRGHADSVPLLLVVDTFEEAQALGDQAVQRVEALIDAVIEHLPYARIVFAGRDAVLGSFEGADRLMLLEFDSASRISFLEKRGLSRKIASAVASQVGGRPLALLLAARLVKEQGLDAISVSLKDRFRGLFDRCLIDGILYQRILDHINDDDVKALAHPGLVLRRIDAEVLQKVVAPVLGFGEISSVRAEKILSALRRQKDLVRSEPDGSVTHRTDVREQMLALMALEKPDLVKALHAAAAKYYAARQNAQTNNKSHERDRIEEIYHRLSIGDSLDRIPELWFPGARLELARSINEIVDVAGQGTLKVMLGRIPTADEVAVLPDKVLREYATKAVSAAIKRPEPERALAILAEFPQHVDASLKRSVEPRALDMSGHWASARRLFVNSVEEQGTRLPIDDALAAADFFERMHGQEIYRDVMSSLLMEQGVHGLQTRSINSRKWYLARVKLKVRQGQYGNGRPSLEEIELGTGPSAFAISESPTTDFQWAMTLTDEIDRNGTRLIESMPVTDTVRGQLAYVRALLRDDANHSEDAAIGVRVCDVLEQGRTIGMRAQEMFAKSPEREILARILRHLFRPKTPQWYIPIACLLRRKFGESVRSADLYLHSLPELPFQAASTLRTTRTLADYLGRLDQLGVLHVCLQRRISRQPQVDGDGIEGILAGYLEWRNVMLFDVDSWFASFKRIRKLSGVGSRNK